MLPRGCLQVRRVGQSADAPQ